MKKNFIIAITSIVFLGIIAFSVNAMAKSGEWVKMPQTVKNSEMQIKKDITENLDKDLFKKISLIATEFINNCHNDEQKERNENFDIEYIMDNVTNENYFKVRGNGSFMFIDENGVIKTYLNTNPTTKDKSYEELNDMISKISGLNLEKIANEIFQAKKLVKNPEDYTYCKVVEKSNYFPTAWFESRKDERTIFFAFNPNTMEILNMGNQKMILSQNNEIEVSEDEAIKTAVTFLDKERRNVKNVELTEVIPNEFYQELKEDEVYTQLDYKRNAYVVTFDDINSLQVYVDATTCEVIGGNGIW